MNLRLDGKVALVTGASKGIGLAIARGMAEAGASVMLSSRKAEGLEAAAATFDSAEHDRVAWFAANAGDEAAPEAAVAATIERFGSVDILVNNAATNPYMGPTLGISASQMDKTHQVNQRAIVLWTAAAWNACMRETGGSHHQHLVGRRDGPRLRRDRLLQRHQGRRAAHDDPTRERAGAEGPRQCDFAGPREDGLRPCPVGAERAGGRVDGSDEATR